jgi:type II secretory pathway pseudopilin PulG
MTERNPQPQQGLSKTTQTGSKSGEKSTSSSLQQQQQQPRSSRRARMQPESIAVLICGWPDPAASNVAKACEKRGFKVLPFGLASSNEQQQKQQQQRQQQQQQQQQQKQQQQQQSQQREEQQQYEIVPFSDPNAKRKLTEAIEKARRDERFVVIVDTSPDAASHVSLYNELKVPFVLQTQGGQAHAQAVHETQQANSTQALISERLNKRLSVMDQMWTEWSRRYPGLFDDFEFSFKSSNPSETPRSLLNSFSDLVNRELGVDAFTREEQGKTKSVEGHLTREYSFKNGSGSSEFTFRQDVNEDEEYADSVADSVAFLAQKSQEIARPQVFNILDVAAQSRMLTW